MKRMNLTLDRISISLQTANHIKVTIFNVEFDYSFEELFAVSLRNKDNSLTVLCRNMLPEEKQHSGQHFNTLEPNKKLRLNQREWKKRVNDLLRCLNLDIPRLKND